jgi:hypothetical protein
LGGHPFSTAFFTVSHPHLDLFVTRLEEAVKRIFLLRLGCLRANVPKILGGGVPVVYGQLKSVDFLDVVLVGQLGDVAQDVYL